MENRLTNRRRRINEDGKKTGGTLDRSIGRRGYNVGKQTIVGGKMEKTPKGTGENKMGKKNKGKKLVLGQ